MSPLDGLSSAAASVLDQRLLVPADGVVAPAPLEVVQCGAELRAIERKPGLGVVWLVADRLGVFGDSGVVFLAPLEVAPAAQRRRGSAAAGQDSGRYDKEEAAFSAVGNLRQFQHHAAE